MNFYIMETPSRPLMSPAGWPSFHLAHPGPGFAKPGDPNCAFFWNGSYHLHYIYRSEDGYAFAHVSSPDLVHWTWHPTTLTPSTMGHGMWSGTGFITKDGRPAIIYHGAGPGDYYGYGLWMNQLAIALDDDLETWSVPATVEATTRPDQDASIISNWDPDAWLDGDTYYAIFGGHPGSGKQPTLLRSADLETWDLVGLLMDRDMPDVDADEDISCPNFFALGNKHMLLCISHTRGCRYYIGEWTGEKFVPELHGRMNWSQGELHVSPELNFFAPESVLTPDGRRVMWAWCISPLLRQSGVQSLPRELTLHDEELRISPIRELESLRSDGHVERHVHVKDGEAWIIPSVFGDALELEILVPGQALSKFGVLVYPDPASEGGYAACVDVNDKTVSIGPVSAPFRLAPGESCRMRVFIDKNIIEVFVNDRQAIAAVHPDLLGPGHVSVFTAGTDLRVESVKTWTISSVYA